MEARRSSGNAAEQFLVTDWASTAFSSYNVSSSNMPTIERIPSISYFGSESLSEIIGSFGLPGSTPMTSDIHAQEFPSTIEHGSEKIFKGKKRKKLPECGAPLVSNQNVDAEQQKDVPTETGKSQMEKDEKKQTNEVSPGEKETGDSAKEDYVHFRAKRGQATNSHSLAERVRREKISERMRLLQDLVPGCNKITGKAVMLDEIINYVQSLQRQVEFLSMKLAAVNPETDLDIEQILTKENFHSIYGSSTVPGYCPSLPNSGNLLRTATNPQISPMAQIANAWDREFQNAFQMGLIPNLPHDEMELNGSMKVEL